MGRRIFVGNLAYSTTEEGLRGLFDNGERSIVDVRIIIDRTTGRSRGFGFVELGNESDVPAAISELDGAELEGRRLAIREAFDRPRREPGERPIVSERFGGGGGGERFSGGPPPPLGGDRPGGDRGRKGWDRSDRGGGDRPGGDRGPGDRWDRSGGGGKPDRRRGGGRKRGGRSFDEGDDW